MHARGRRHCVCPSLVEHWRDGGRCHGLRSSRRGGSTKDVRKRGIPLIIAILVGVAPLLLLLLLRALARRCPGIVLVVGHDSCAADSESSQIVCSRQTQGEKGGTNESRVVRKASREGGQTLYNSSQPNVAVGGVASRVVVAQRGERIDL
jgi:hypothetical protein